MHFDVVDNITVQVKGSKLWSVGPNRIARDPTESCVTLEQLKPELRQYAQSNVPSAMPADAETYLLEPGAALYFPRGYWHQTSSEEESVSLHIHLPPDPWLDVTLAALRARLLRDERWRRDSASLRDPARVDWTAEGALRALRDAVAELAPDDLALTEEAAPTADRPVVRRARTALVVDSIHPDGRATVSVFVEATAVTHTTTMKLSAPLLAAARRIAGATRPLSARDLAAAQPGLTVRKALALVRALRAAGFVRAATSPARRATRRSAPRR
jgi:50S ribosomal protein L16 3-hydroxylase